MEEQNLIMKDKNEEDDEEEEEKDNKGKKLQLVQQQVQPNTAAASPPSSSSSPEFTFTISLHPTATKIPDNKNKTPPSPPAVDFSPADEIFFHGHLLPLHLLSHHIAPASPRSSTNSIDNFTLPIKELSQQNHGTTTTVDHDAKVRKKSKSFSLFGSKWSKQSSTDMNRSSNQEEKRKSKFEALKRYIRLVKPFISSLRNGKIRNRNMVRQSYSCYSENLRVKNKKELRGGFSAPASMWNSPTNSGRLVASGSLTPITTSTSDSSTMEDLQAAIQAAIAHCKNSIATQDQMKMPSSSSSTTTTTF